MTPEQIKRCAEGAPPPCEYSEALTFLATTHLKLIEALRMSREALSRHWFTEDGEESRNNNDVIEADKACLALLSDLAQSK